MISKTLNKKVVLTQAQFNARQTAGTLEEGVEYQILGEAFPECPTTTDGTFTLQCVVSSGTATYSWV